MAKISITGSAAVITSALKLEDLKLIKKYRPEALTLMGGKDNDEELYTIDVLENEAPGAINRFGATFGTATRDENKLAVITAMINLEGVENSKISDYVADLYGGAIMNINKLEATLPAVVEAIGKEREAIKSNITVG